METTDEQWQAEADEQDIQDALGRHNNEMMAALGFQRLPNGAWRDEDLQYLFDQIDSQGIGWAYALLQKS